jgi:hypothetical protein
MEKSVVAECSIETNYKIGFGEATVLAKSTGYMNRLVMKAIEIRLHPSNFNRDIGFMLNQTWYPLINLLQKRRKLERDEVWLSNTATKQKLETDCPSEERG